MERLEYGGHSCHPGSEGKSATSLELPEHVLEGRPGRVAIAAVSHGAARVVGAREDDRHVQRRIGLARSPSRHHRDRLRVECAFRKVCHDLSFTLSRSRSSLSRRLGRCLSLLDHLVE